MNHQFFFVIHIEKQDFKKLLHGDTWCGTAEGKTDRDNCSYSVGLRFGSPVFLHVAIFLFLLICYAVMSHFHQKSIQK
jgi:hypothetical protein